MDKEVAVGILENVKHSLYNENAKQKGLSTVNQYIKGLEITENQEIQQLISKQQEYVNKYGADDKRTLKINKRIYKEIQKIFNG